MLAAKAYDMVMGVDIHILIIPPGVPTPIPHPHIGMLFDPMDFVPVVGATVHVNNQPRGQAGTAGKTVPPHIPLGGSFTKPPGNESEVFMGSSTVVVDGAPFSFLGVPVLGCHDVGMPSPPRSKKKGSKPTMFLPTSTLMAIPAGQPVMIGGPPTIDMMAMAMKMGMSSLGKLAGGAKKAAKKAKSAKGAKKLGAAAKNNAPKNLCTTTGHPVDVADGKVFTDALDIDLPGPVPFRWERTWYSNSKYEGPIGHGWHHNYDMSLYVDADEQIVSLRMCDGRAAAFPFLAPGEEYFDRKEKLTYFRDEKGWGYRDKENLYYRFQPSAYEADIQLLSGISDIDGHAIEFSYDLQGRLKTIVDSAGRKFDVINNPKGQITEIRTAHLPENFKLVNYYYDSYGDLLQVLDPADKATVYNYQDHLLVKETDRNGLSFYFTWVGRDENAKCVHTWGDGGIYDHKIAYKEGVTEVTNSLGYKTIHILDGQGLVSQTIDANGNSSYTEFSADMDLMRETDPSGLTYAYAYDQRGNQTAMVMPDGATYTTEYNEWDQPVLSIDPVGKTTMWQYDEKGRLLRRIEANGQISSFKYEDGMVSSIMDNITGELKFEYDKYCNLIAKQLQDGGTYNYRYDGMGNMTIAADPKGNTEQYIYDRRNNPVQINHADGNVQYLNYDGEENVVHSRDNQHDVRYDYRGLDKLHAMTDNGTKVEFIYDTEENLSAIKNEHGNVYKFNLDPTGLIQEERGFDGISRRYQRDGAGKILKTFRQNGLVTEFKYDDGGRITLEEHSDGSKAQFVYRPDGDLALAQNEFITVEFERDENGNITKEIQGKHEVNSIYNTLGFRTGLTSSLGASFTFERNDKQDILSATASNGKATWKAGFRRETLGLEIERSLPGGLTSKWERDKLGRPMRHTVSKTNGTVYDKSYRWNVNERLQGIFNEIKKASTIFTHDDLGQLSAVQYEDGHQDFKMPDAVGNLFRTREQKDRKYGPAGQLLEADGIQYFYDAEGNLIRKSVAKTSTGELLMGNWEYTWYANGRLKEVLRPDSEKVSFQYDALGRRIAKTFKGNTTRWVWDGNNPLHEWVEEAGASIKEEDSALKVNNDGQLVAQTAWHAKLLQPVTTWVFEADGDGFTPMSKLVGDTGYSIISDQIGTPVAMYDDQGTTVWDAEYDIYGKVRKLEGRLSACPFRYQGQYEDEETGLYLNGYRYYDPVSGIYLSQDPLLTNGGLAFYAYVPDVNNWVDPLGLAKKLAPCQKGTQRWMNKVRKDGKPYRKPGPKTDINAPHNKKIRSVIRQQKKKGLKHIGGGTKKELIVDTPGGKKPYRRMDASFENPQTGEITHHNVGLSNKNGTPIARERAAVNDIQTCADASNQNITFHSYGTK